VTFLQPQNNALVAFVKQFEQCMQTYQQYTPI